MIKLKKLLKERAIMKKNYTGGNYGKISFSNLELKILKSGFIPGNVSKESVTYEWETSEYDDEGSGVTVTKEPYDKDKNFTVYVSHAWEYDESGRVRKNKDKSAASQKFEGEAPKLLNKFLDELNLGDW